MALSGLGQFDTLNDLQTAHPTATVEDFAFVGTGVNKIEYRWSEDGGGTWYDAEKVKGVQASSFGYESNPSFTDEIGYLRKADGSSRRLTLKKAWKGIMTQKGDLTTLDADNQTPIRIPAGINDTVLRYVDGIPTPSSLDDLYITQTLADTLYSPKIPQILWVRTIADLPTPTDTGDGNGLAYHITQQVLKFANTGALAIPYTIVGDNGLIINCESRQFVSYAGASGTSMFKVPVGAGLSFAQCFFQTITSIDGVPRSFCEGVVLSSLTCRGVTMIDFNKSFYNVSVVTYCQLDGVAIRDNSILGGPGVPIAEGIWINGLGLNSTKISVSVIDIQFAQILSGVDKSYLKITGNIQSAGINEFSCQPRNGESGIYLAQNLGYTGISINSCPVKPATGTTGSALHPNSLTQKDLGIIVSASPDGAIPNSTSSFEMAFQGNTTPTVIGALNTPTPLGNIIRISNDILAERLVFQDTITSFDSGTNIITMPFTHSLVANDVVFFHTYTGTLPTGILPNKKYYIISPTTTTFKISTTLGGAEVDFTTNGSGTNYIRHFSGNSNTGWIVNIGGASAFHIDGISSLQVSGTVDGVFRRQLMFSNNTTGAITTLTNGFGSSAYLSSSGGGAVTNGSSQTSKDIQLETGEGILLYIERISGTGNVIVTNQITNFTKK